MADKRPVVFIAGPISNRGTLPPEKQKENVAAAAKAGLQLLVLGYSPIIPHLSWFIDSAHVFSEYWYEADYELVRRSDYVLRLPGESAGADREVALAESLNIRVFRSVQDMVRWTVPDTIGPMS